MNTYDSRIKNINAGYQIALVAWKNPARARYSFGAWYYIAERLVRRGYKQNTVIRILSGPLMDLIADISPHSTLTSAAFFETFEQLCPPTHLPDLNGPLRTPCPDKPTPVY